MTSGTNGERKGKTMRRRESEARRRKGEVRG
jgi:hypothetical protein